MLATLARFEWILVELIVLGVLVWQLVSVRRGIKADRAAARLEAARLEASPLEAAVRTDVRRGP